MSGASKNRSFKQRFICAFRGWKAAFRSEASFRQQVVLAGGAILVLGVLRPEPIWWAIFLVIIGAVLAAELLNSALEVALDLVHPDIHPMVAKAKDCAAGAVLVLSFSALGVLTALLSERFFKNQ